MFGSAFMFSGCGEQGERGERGEKGEQGIQGEAGLAGASWITGTEISGAGANITANIGGAKIGDLYLNLETCDVYKCTAENVWAYLTNIKGSQGEQGAQGQQGEKGEQGQQGQTGQNGSDGQDGADGSYWLTGTTAPNNTIGKDGDIYLNTSNYDLYQKNNGVWELSCNIKGQQGEDGATGEQGLPGNDGKTPYIGGNGNWWIDEVDTGYCAVGKNGESSTISINDEGFIIINGENTGYSAKLTQQELYQNLKGLIEYDDGSYSFTSEYESVAGYNQIKQWEYTTSVFSGWAGSIGKPEKIEAIKFKIRARETPVTKINVLLSEKNKDGKLVSSGVLDVNVEAGQEADIIWILDSPIVNSGNINYYFGFTCNTFIDKFGLNVNCSIPEEEIAEADEIRYAVNGELTDTFAVGFVGITGANGPKPVYSYLPVQVGTVLSTFRLANSVVEKILDMVNVEEELYTNKNLVLPQTVYGYVGQKMQIYFRNICAYNLEDVYIQATSTSRGNQFKDRWEYTPEAAEQFVLKIDIYSKNWNLLSSSSFNVVVKDSVSKTTAKALVIGDSTVNAGTETSKMVSLSDADENFDLTLLGTRGTGTNLHEGRGGWTASGYVNNANSGELTNPFYNPETKKFDFEYYMTTQGYNEEGVDVVFIQLGINDIFGRDTSNLQAGIDTFLTNMQFMIDNILQYNADIKVVINLIIPCDQDQDAFSSTYGTMQTVWGYMRNMYKANQQLLEKFAGTQNVYLSWYNAALDCVNNQGGNVHPAQSGYEQLGTQMYYFLKAIL